MTARLRTLLPWLALALGIVLLLPGLGQRMAVERANATYEVSVTFPDLTAMRFGGVSLDRSLSVLGEAGLGSVAVDMPTIRDFERDGVLTLLGRGDFLSLLLASGEDPSAMPTEGDWFVALGTADGEDVIDRVRRASPVGEIDTVTLAGQRFFVVSGMENLPTLPLGYDDEQIRDILDRGLGVIARVRPNLSTPEFGAEELSRMQREYGIDRITFTGDEPPFTTDPAGADRFAAWLRDNDFALILEEGGAPTGRELFAETVELALRQRTVGIPPDADARIVTDAVRAVRERNVRIVSLRPTPLLSADDRLALLADAVRDVHDALPAELEPGIAQPFDQLSSSPLQLAGSAIASGALAYIAVALAGVRIGVVSGLGVALLVVGASITGSDRLGDLARLVVAILAAVAAVFAARPAHGIVPMTGQYLRAAIVVVAGGLTLSGLVTESAFLVGAREFWGVKALLFGPLVIVGAVAAYLSLGSPRLADVVSIARSPVRIWHIAILAVAAGAAWFMLVRSGNSAIQIDVELVMRQQLEELFVVRPRTKEFLIGFPALLLGIAATWHTRHGWWLAAVAAIGTASALNTFSHFHSPILISLLRTGYGLALGYAIGLVLFLLARLALRLARRTGFVHGPR